MKFHISTFRRFFVHHISNRLSTPHFLLVHHLYFLATIFICSIAFWLFSRPHADVPFIDCLFTVVSAITSTGLTTRNLSTFNTAQQVLIWILIAIGSPTFISVSVVWIRRRAFESKFASVISGKQHKEQSSVSNTAPSPLLVNTSVQDFLSIPYNDSLADGVKAPAFLSTAIRQASFLTIRTERDVQIRPMNASLSQGNGVILSEAEFNSSEPTLNSNTSTTSFFGAVKVFGNAMVGRNSQFYGLTRHEREQLGCIEYKALKFLSILVPAYLLAFQVLGSIALGSFISQHQANLAYENGSTPWWLGVFDGVSAFNNAGMSLLDLNMIPFGRSYYVLLTVAFLTLAGNTAYPIFLRLILWVMLHLTPRTSAFQEWRDIMSFILKYPRRVYTHLFPSNPTWWLVLILFILNGIDFISFEALNRTNPTFIALSPVHRNLDGLVQTIFIRSAGFTVISISSLRIGLQVLYVPMMFISAFPVAITMRSSNVYEERSLGIYASELRAQPPPFSTLEASGSASLLTHTSRTRLYFLRTQISQQLSHDFWFVVICSILIIWIETGSIDRDPLTFSVFNILFEVVSAYACVGLSIGLPDENYALSGKFHTSSKVILCCLMFRGRHRDLPVAIDRAVQLPDGILEGREQEKGDRVSGVLAGEL